jgi:hypothetical protein
LPALGFLVEALPEALVLAGRVGGVAATSGAHVAVAHSGLEGLLVFIPSEVVGLIVTISFTVTRIILILGAVLRVRLVFTLILVAVLLAILSLLLVILRLTASLATSSATPECVGVLDGIINPLARGFYRLVLLAQGFFQTAFCLVLVCLNLLHGFFAFSEAPEHVRVALEKLLKLGQTALSA